MANVYTVKGDYNKALESYNRSLNIKRELGNVRAIGKNLYVIGSVYFLISQLGN